MIAFIHLEKVIFQPWNRYFEYLLQLLLSLLTSDVHFVESLRVFLPGVIQLESKRASVGSTSPLSRAFFILSSASLADLDTQTQKTPTHADIKESQSNSQSQAVILSIFWFPQSLPKQILRFSSSLFGAHSAILGSSFRAQLYNCGTRSNLKEDGALFTFKIQHHGAKMFIKFNFFIWSPQKKKNYCNNLNLIFICVENIYEWSFN